MSFESFVQNPTFLLKGLDFSSIREDYINGKFYKEKEGKKKIIFNIKTEYKSLTDDYENEIYSLNKNNCKEFYTTSGHKAFHYYRENNSLPKDRKSVV